MASDEAHDTRALHGRLLIIIKYVKKRGVTDDKSLNKLRNFINQIKNLQDAHDFNHRAFLVILSNFSKFF